MMKTLGLATVPILALLVAACVDVAAMRPVTEARDHVMGNPNAEISLVEYSDFECPFCKRFHETAKRVIHEYAGEVNWVCRHFPLVFHNPAAQREAEASECAAELGGKRAMTPPSTRT